MSNVPSICDERKSRNSPGAHKSNFRVGSSVHLCLVISVKHISQAGYSAYPLLISGVKIIDFTSGLQCLPFLIVIRQKQKQKQKSTPLTIVGPCPSPRLLPGPLLSSLLSPSCQHPLAQSLFQEQAILFAERITNWHCLSKQRAGGWFIYRFDM